MLLQAMLEVQHLRVKELEQREQGLARQLLHRQQLRELPPEPPSLEHLMQQAPLPPGPLPRIQPIPVTASQEIDRLLGLPTQQP